MEHDTNRFLEGRVKINRKFVFSNKLLYEALDFYQKNLIIRFTNRNLVVLRILILYDLLNKCNVLLLC